MRRIVDIVCHACNFVKMNVYVDEADKVPCSRCGAETEQKWWGVSTAHAAQWGDRDAVVVFENPNPLDDKARFSFPARNTKPCPKGWIRHEARSDQQVAQLEKLTGTLQHNRHYDNGSGRGFDDEYRGKKYS